MKKYRIWIPAIVICLLATLGYYLTRTTDTKEQDKIKALIGVWHPHASCISDKCERLEVSKGRLLDERQYTGTALFGDQEFDYLVQSDNSLFIRSKISQQEHSFKIQELTPYSLIFSNSDGDVFHYMRKKALKISSKVKKILLGKWMDDQLTPNLYSFSAKKISSDPSSDSLMTLNGQTAFYRTSYKNSITIHINDNEDIIPFTITKISQDEIHFFNTIESKVVVLQRLQEFNTSKILLLGTWKPRSECKNNRIGCNYLTITPQTNKKGKFKLGSKKGKYHINEKAHVSFIISETSTAKFVISHLTKDRLVLNNYFKPQEFISYYKHNKFDENIDLIIGVWRNSSFNPRDPLWVFSPCKRSESSCHGTIFIGDNKKEYTLTLHSLQIRSRNQHSVYIISDLNRNDLKMVNEANSQPLAFSRILPISDEQFMTRLKGTWVRTPPCLCQTEDCDLFSNYCHSINVASAKFDGSHLVGKIEYHTTPLLFKIASDFSLQLTSDPSLQLPDIKSEIPTIPTFKIVELTDQALVLREFTDKKQNKTWGTISYKKQSEVSVDPSDYGSLTGDWISTYPNIIHLSIPSSSFKSIMINSKKYHTNNLENGAGFKFVSGEKALFASIKLINENNFILTDLERSFEYDLKRIDDQSFDDAQAKLFAKEWNPVNPEKKCPPAKCPSLRIRSLGSTFLGGYKGAGQWNSAPMNFSISSNRTLEVSFKDSSTTYKILVLNHEMMVLMNPDSNNGPIGFSNQNRLDEMKEMILGTWTTRTPTLSCGTWTFSRKMKLRACGNSVDYKLPTPRSLSLSYNIDSEIQYDIEKLTATSLLLKDRTHDQLVHFNKTYSDSIPKQNR